MVGLWCYNLSGVTELLVKRDPHYGRMCFKLFSAVEKASATAFSTAKNLELLELYSILKDF